MKDKPQSRDLSARENTAQVENWVKPQMLPDPIPVDGIVFRWIRIGTNGTADPTNFSSKIREGWEPCKAVDHPEIPLVTIENERFADNVVMGGLMLCRIPERIAQQRNEFYSVQTKGQMESVDNHLMRQNDPRMPMFSERTSKVSEFGDGR
jgi:hypothetical protein